jgi:hypothetical protein
MRSFSTRPWTWWPPRLWGVGPGGACLAAILGGCVAVRTAPAQQSNKVNPDALQVEKFGQQVAAYEGLHKNAAAQLPALKPKESRAKLLEYQGALTTKIRAARPHAKQGNLFTPPVASEFRRLIRLSMQGREAARIRASLKRGEPVSMKVAVNGSYPSSVPLETTPPSLLLNLPELPPELEYRVVGHTLVLRDATANLIVDFLPNAIP